MSEADVKAREDSVIAEDLVKVFGDIRAVDGVSFRVRSGEIFGFLGPNGAGKTTTIKVLTGLAKPTSGRALVDGHDVVRDHVRAKLRLGVVSQDPNVDPDLTARENLLIHGLLFRMDSGSIRQRADEMLRFVGLAEHAGRRVRKLSGGMKRRVQIARALMHEPKVLMLDEPTVGLDAHARRDIWAAIRRINASGATVFLTTHYIEEAESLCNRVAVIDHGRLIALDTPQDLVVKVGAFSVDVLDDGKLETHSFPTRDEAVAFVADRRADLTIRQANLEDYFLRETGRRIDP
jgi:ABC-2 type transport system ATP-binding protein